MPTENITICHVPTGERFRFDLDPGIHCGCWDGRQEDPRTLRDESFDYAAATYRVSCSVCGGELAVCEAV